MWAVAPLCCVAFMTSIINEVRTYEAMAEFIWDVPVTELMGRDHEFVESPTFVTYNHHRVDQWKLKVNPKYSCSPYCGFGIYVCKISNHIAIEQRFKLFLSNYKSNELTLGDNLNTGVFNKSTCFGYWNFTKPDIVLDRTNGYLFGNSIKVGVKLLITIDPPIRFSLLGTNEVNLSAIRNALNQLRMKKSYTDLTLVTAQASFPAHRVILASQSSVFDEKFRNLGNEMSHFVKIRDEECAVVDSLLEYMYSGSVSNISAVVTALVPCAHHYNVTGLKPYCEDHMKYDITCRNSYERLVLSDKFDLPRLKDLVLNYIVNNGCPVIGKNSKTEISTHPYLLAEVVSKYQERNLVRRKSS